uniref:Uncharacterized protein n=1 Tax=Arundo donax TaxID=35708 RepID=A0A0A9DK80_ARUDO
MSSSFLPVVLYASISGSLLIVSNILYAAACPPANAFILGDACPRASEPVSTAKITFMTWAPV